MRYLIQVLRSILQTVYLKYTSGYSVTWPTCYLPGQQHTSEQPFHRLPETYLEHLADSLGDGVWAQDDKLCYFSCYMM